MTQNIRKLTKSKIWAYSSGRTFGDDNQADPSRVGEGADRITGITDFSTVIGSTSGGHDKTVGSLRRAAIMANRSENNAQAGFQGIDQKCTSGNLPRQVCDEAKRIYDKIQKSETLQIHNSIKFTSFVIIWYSLEYPGG